MFCALLLSLVLGCSGKAGTTDNGGTPQDAGDDVASDDAGSSPLSGTYKGYIESYMFPDGSDTVVMALMFASDGSITGTVFFGDGAPLAPPTDPNVGYPPGYNGPPGDPRGMEGFAFTALDGSYAAPRARLGIQPTEMWKQWCEIQTTIYPQYNGTTDGGCGNFLGYGCLPNAATMCCSNCQWSSCDHPAWTNIDCEKLRLCGELPVTCVCTSTSCTVPLTPPGNVAFDMQLVAGALSGSVSGLGNSVLNVHLTRQP
jgi:hypothetical protein